MPPENDNETQPQRVVLDLLFTPDDPSTFVPDEVMRALDGIGTIGEVRLLWAGDANGPIGNIPWPRTPPEDEQRQTDEALAQIEEEANAPEPEVEQAPPDPDPNEVNVGVPGQPETRGEDELAEDNAGYSPRSEPSPVDDPAPEQSAPKDDLPPPDDVPTTGAPKKTRRKK